MGGRINGSQMGQDDLVNFLSVDVEEYFQVAAFERIVDPAQWDGFESRVTANTTRILDLFDRYCIRATFFVVGWVAERFPDLVIDIRERGHEVACHSYWHRKVYDLTPEEFAEDTGVTSVTSWSSTVATTTSGSSNRPRVQRRSRPVSQWTENRCATPRSIWCRSYSV